MERNRIVVYSAITGDYDSVNLPKHDEPDVDFVLFTDNPMVDHEHWSKAVYKPWTLRGIEVIPRDVVRTARKVKILPHLHFPDYDISVWVDGNMEIHGRIRKFVDQHLGDQLLAIHLHPDRQDIYSEARACVQLGKDDGYVIQEQILKYMDTEASRGPAGLFHTNIIIRRHNDPLVIKTMEAWWAEVKKYSRRDQISFPIVCKETGLKPSPIPGYGNDNECFRRKEHCRR